MTEDVGNRLTEMLDEQPGKQTPEDSTILEIDESALVEDYKRVQSSEITDAATIRRLASMFAAVADDSVLVRQVSFDASHAAIQLCTYADTL